MKTTSLLLLLTLAFFQHSFAQVLECTASLASGTQPAFSIVMPGADQKLADAAWKEYLKPYGKVSRIRGAKENVASDVQVIDIGGVNRLDIYSLSEAGSDGTKMTVWFDTGAGFISSQTHPKEYVAAVNFIKTYAHQVKLEQIAMELEEQQKLLSKAESNLSKLQRENENLHKIIEDSRKRIEQAEKDIESNLSEQADAQKQIGAQTVVVEEVQKKLEEAKRNP